MYVQKESTISRVAKSDLIYFWHMTKRSFGRKLRRSFNVKCPELLLSPLLACSIIWLHDNTEGQVTERNSPLNAFLVVSRKKQGFIQ